MERLLIFKVIQQKTETINQNSFTFGYAYNKSTGMLETYTYPSGFALMYVYNQGGDMSSIFGFFGSYWGSLWKGTQQNQRGQWINYQTPSLYIGNSYDDYGYPTGTIARKVPTMDLAQDYRYSFESTTGNLSWRTDAVRGLKESFTYDDQLHSRLTGWSVNSQNQAELQYQPNGNISRKTDVSNKADSYIYNPWGKPHAVTSVSQPTPAFVSAAPEQSITYTPFNKVSFISNTYPSGRNYELHITYGPDNQRKFSLLAEDQGVGLPLLTETYYLGQYETKRDLPSTEQKIHYLNGPTGLFGILVKQANSEQLYYVLKDHLGSITGVADVSGNILENLSYDPWGRRRNANDWTDYNVSPTRFDRGFTGHEHLSQFGLINMNGRVYDPFLARFLSPDPQLQAPDYSQNYNRYSYAWNNPLKYTDPSGEFIFTALAILTGQLWALPITIGADIGAITGGIRGANSDVGFWTGAGRGALVGGIGGAFAPMGGAGMTFGANLLLGTAQGAVTGGLDAILWGEDIGNGLKWGAFSGAIFATLTSSNLKNLTKGKGFYNNANVYENFRNGKYAIPSGSSWQQEALNHFGFEGTYDPNAPIFEKYGVYPGVTDPVSGEIFYHDFPFDANYDRFAFIADHELVHRTNVLTGKYRGIKMSPVIKALEEVDAYTHNYWNQGLYPKHGIDVLYRIQNNEWNALRDGFSKKWWHFTNKIPRRW